MQNFSGITRFSPAIAMFIALVASFAPDSRAAEKSGAAFGNDFQAPVDLELTSDGKWLVTANEKGNSTSLIDVRNLKMVDTVRCGLQPAAIELLDDRECFVSCSESGEVYWFQFDSAGIKTKHVFQVGHEPCGIAVDSRQMKAYVGLVASSEVAVIDLTSKVISKRIEVGTWPRYVALTPDGSRLAVGASGDGKLYVVDTQTGESKYDEALSGGINLGHVRTSKNGEYAYFPAMIYRTNPIDIRNIRLGWVLASRIVRVRLDGPAVREAISLDVPGMAIADPHGIAFTPNDHRLVVSASGTHELLVYRLKDLPFEGTGGPGDLIDRRLMQDEDLFSRIELGGRPMGVVAGLDNRTVYVANYTKDCIQVVDVESKRILSEIPVGNPERQSLAFRGMEIFYDGRRSLDQWYSCHTCHYNGGVNSRAMDTKNDGSNLTFKTVLPLVYVTKTAPWTWHGWQNNLEESIAKSFTESMQGPPISRSDVDAVLAYLDTLYLPRNPNLNQDGSLSQSAARGKLIFESDVAGCAKCHSGDLFTDGQIHDVGLGSESDRYKGYNTPTLRGLYRKVRFLHDGRTKSLDTLLGDMHSPEKVSGTASLTDDQRRDLIEYLKSL